MTAAEQFAEFVRTHAVKAGYDLSSSRSGGKKKLADDTGISHASVCRMLNGQVIPVAEVFESLAESLDVHVGHLFELAGVVSPGVLIGTELPEPQRLSMREAAARLGIRSPLHIALFEAVTTTLLAEQEAAA